MNINYQLIIAVIITLWSFQASALNLQQAKDAGNVGETTSGYLEARVTTTEVTNLVTQVNQKRKQLYQKMASKNQVSLSEIEKLAGKKAIKKTRKGHYIKQGNQWIKK